MNSRLFHKGILATAIVLPALSGAARAQNTLPLALPPPFGGTAQAGVDGAPKCTLATLKGRYLFAAPATLFPPAFGLTEQAVGNAAGYHVFNGNGTGQDYVTATLNGVDQHVPSPNDLTYTLNSDCTGTYSLLPLGQGLPTFDIFVSPNGDEMTSINTDPGSASSYTPSRRVAPK
jgi:hypothetical protein